MTLAVWLQRENQLRWVEGLIREAHRRGHYVLGILDRTTHHPLKPAPSLSGLPARLYRYAVWYQCETPASSHRVARRADVVVMPGPGGDLREAGQAPMPGPCSIQTEWGAGSFLPAVDLRWEQIGYPPADALAWTDPDEVRQTFGLRGDTLMVLPFPHASTARSAWTVWWRWWGERRVTRAIRHLADRANLSVVVKSRAKQPVPRHLAEMADAVVTDDEPGEPTALRLLTTAQLIVHAYSMTAIDAVWANVPALCVAPTAKQWPAYGRHLSTPGFTDLFSQGAMRPPEAVVDWLDQSAGYWPMPDRSGYLTRHFGGVGLDSGARILHALSESGPWKAARL